MNENTDFSDLKALFINCSLKRSSSDSHTLKLIKRSAGIMEAEGVGVEIIHALDHHIAFGMEKDLKEHGQKQDDWPEIHARVMVADILVLGSPIWLGVKSSVATLVVERLYAYSGDHNAKDQYLYYGKTAGCLITGNEDGVKACSMDILYSMQHIGYTIPPQADAGWIGEVGPGPSYGDKLEGVETPVGFDSEFTNKNTTFMSWNLMHMARILKDNDGLPAIGNTTKGWRQVTNAGEQSVD